MKRIELREKHPLYLALFIIILYAVVVIHRAWVCDDAYITFRTIKNVVVHGTGLLWNTSERVQVYTHPLWMIILTGFYFIYNNIFLVSIFLSIIISVAGLVILEFKISRTILSGGLAVLVLALSNAYVDFSTSGLENPLTHLLLVIFLWIYLAREDGPRKLFWLSLVSSLGILNRMDTGLLYLPLLLYAFFKLGRKQFFNGLLWAAAGQMPFILWEIFAVLNYGFPFPNTAYAKINGVIPMAEVLIQARWYFLQSLKYDPITLVVILIAVAGVLWSRNKRLLPLAASILLYLSYVISLGGDFMGGRFFTAPLLVAAIILSQVDFLGIRVRHTLAVYIGVTALGLLAPMPVFLLEPPVMESQMDYHTITDERLYYSSTTRLFRKERFNIEMGHRWGDIGKKTRLENPEQVVVYPSIGFYGYYVGPYIYVVDHYGLGNALLARLPPYHEGRHWRPGHFKRVVPEGYIETLESTDRENLITDQNLAAYYEKLRLIISGDLLSRQRLEEIWKINTGAYDHLIDFDTYRYPQSVTVRCSSTGCNPGGQPVQLGERGMLLVFEELVYPEEITIELIGAGNFDIELSRDEKAILWQSYQVTGQAGGTIAMTDLPASVHRKGINKIFIFPFDKQPPYAMVKVTVY